MVVVADGTTSAIAGFSVGTVAVAAGISDQSPQVTQQFRGSILPEFRYGDSVGAAGAPVWFAEAGDDAVPAQELEEVRLACLVGRVSDSVHQLVHADTVAGASDTGG